MDVNNISENQSKTVILIDDQTLYREALASLIKHQYDVIAQAEFSEPTLELADKLKPDIILADPCFNHEKNIPFIHQLAPRCPKSHILLISSLCSSTYYFDFIRAGVSGIVLKTQSAAVLLKAVDRILANEFWFDRALLTSALKEIKKPNRSVPAQEPASLTSLSKREREIVNLVVKGLNTLAIAKTLHCISVKKQCATISIRCTASLKSKTGWNSPSLRRVMASHLSLFCRKVYTSEMLMLHQDGFINYLTNSL